MIVLDCNAAVEMARGTKDGSALLALVDEDEHTLAPDFFSYELANVISKYVRGRYLERDEALSL